MQRLVVSLLSVCAFATLLVSASAQTVPIGTANFIEWDLPAPASPGASGALEVAPSGNTRSVFYLTRGPAPDPRLIRFNPGSPIGSANATWQSWLLNPGTTTGGLKLRPGEAVGSQTAFIRDSSSIVRLNTNASVNNYTRWIDAPAASISDLALDLPSAGAPANIYTTGPSSTGGILQRLTPPASGTVATVTRWPVGGGAGSIYLSGVATRRMSATSVRVYWSEPTSNMIGELNPATNAVRRWLLPGATQPRQLDLDAAGDVWTVTGSGHVVRLDPANNEITPYFIPTPGSNPTGVGPDGFIGFTETGTNKVGMLIPDGTTTIVPPMPATIMPTSTTITGVTTSRAPSSGTAMPVAKTGPATSSGTAATGIFVEAQLPVAPGLPSMSPIAIEDDTVSVSPPPPPGAFARAFFYSVSTPTTSRIGRVELVRPAPEPTTLDLNPPTAINPVDSRHCVTATVRDQYGEPMQGINVEFRVTGSVMTDGDANTDNEGEAEFCYTGPAFPGVDAIHAWADWNPNNEMQDAGEPFGDATKTWILPVSTPGCEVKITNGGWIIAANTDRASFGGNAKVDADGNVSGQEEYQDHGPVQPMNAHGNVLVVTCSPNQTQATIFGNATVDGTGSYLYRIDVKDLGEPGVGLDTYRFRLEPPSTYDSGEQLLRGGNVQIHQD
jgi:hypothetical protein